MIDEVWTFSPIAKPNNQPVSSCGRDGGGHGGGNYTWAGFPDSACCVHGATRLLRDGRATISNPSDMLELHDNDEGRRLTDEHRAQIRAALDAYHRRGLEDARRLVVGIEAVQRAGGEHVERLRSALVEVLGDALTSPHPVEAEPEPARTRRFLGAR